MIPGALWAAAILFSATGLAAGPSLILINNGLAPPEPLNVIDASDDWAEEEVLVRNLGCGTPEDPDAFCDFPMSGTRVEVVDGGAVGSVTIREGSGLTVSGGSVGSVRAVQGAAVLTTGGSIESLAGLESANVVLAGGTVTTATARDESSIGVNIGTTITGVGGRESGEIRIFGGSITDVLVGYDSSTIHIEGGLIGADIQAFDTSAVEILGLDFRIDGVPVRPGEISALSGTLTCELETSDHLDTGFVRAPTARIVLVPEPSAAGASMSALAALAAVAAASRMRFGKSS